MNQQAYRKLISGQQDSRGAAILRFFLRAAAQPYSIIVRLRNLLYSKGWLKICRADAAVISVGNITAGGTGKTPLVIWLCKFLQQKGYRCAVLTRGYKATQATSDEPAILAESCPEARVIINPDRAAGAAEAIGKFGAKILIMDDGFQHRRLARDIDIVTIDAVCPFGYGRILPAGLLREPVAALKRADAVVITRCDQITGAQLAQLEEKLQQVNPNMIIARSIHSPTCAKSLNNKEIGLGELRGKKIFAFCGIGNPDAFLNTIKNIGADMVGSRVYNDHYHYADTDIADICGRAEKLKADLILTTQKDWYSTQYALRNTKYGTPFAYLAIEIRFVGGEVQITQLIEKVLAGRISGK